MVSFQKGPIRQQIESTADYHPAGTYAFGSGSSQVTGFAPLLTFFKSLELQADGLSDSFIPLSAVAQQARNPKLFAVGLLPPTQQVTGRLLDRSASIASMISKSSEEIIDGAPAYEYPLAEAPRGEGVSNTPIKSPASERTPEFWNQYVAMCDRLKQNPENLAAVIYLESGFDPGARNVQGGRVVAQGLNQYTKATAKNPKVGNMTDAEWDAFGNLPAEQQLPYVEKYFRGTPANASKQTLYQRNFGGYANNPDGTLYASASHQAAWKAIHPEATFQNAAYQNTSIQQNSGFVTPHPVTGQPVIMASTLGQKVADLPPRAVRASIAEARAFIAGGGVVPPLPVPGDAGATNTWAASGEAQAQQARRQEGKLANTDLIGSDLGQALLAAQKAQVEAIRSTLAAMASAPPLRMLVNPSKFSIKSSKIVQDSAWSRNGPIIEFWGDDLDKISGAGKVAGFYSIDANATLNQGGPGLTRTARNLSQSWQNFQALWLIYKNNGGIYLQDLSQRDKDLLLSTVGSVYLYYDNILYIGSFDSFNVSETQDSPFTIEYSFEFTVRATFLLEYPDEYSYGAPDLFTNRRGNTSLASNTAYTPPSRFVEEMGSEAAAETLTRPSPT